MKLFKGSKMSEKIRTCVIGGSLDPITNGHLEVIEKASKLFDQIIVVIASNYEKSNAMFSPEERLDMVKSVIDEHPFHKNVSVEILPPQKLFLLSKGI